MQLGKVARNGSPCRKDGSTILFNDDNLDGRFQNSGLQGPTLKPTVQEAV